MNDPYCNCDDRGADEWCPKHNPKPIKPKPCKVCSDRGWLVVKRDGIDVTIQACDTCGGGPSKLDDEAADGVAIQLLGMNAPPITGLS